MINTEHNLGLFDTNLIIIIAVKNSELLSLFTGLMSLSVTKGQLMAKLLKYSEPIHVRHMLKRE